MKFDNRADAGQRLARKLMAYKNKNVVVMAVPRGGVPVAAEVAAALNAPLDVVLVKKIGHPFNREYAIGAAGLKDAYVIPHDGVKQEYVDTELAKIRERLQEMKDKFVGQREAINLKGKTVIVVDDGIATGNTFMATLPIIQKGDPEKIVVATPVVARAAYQTLKPITDEMVVLHIPDQFSGVGKFYHDFTQVSDEEVMEQLRQAGNLPLKA